MFRKQVVSVIALVLVVASFAGCGPGEEAVFFITSPLTDTETRSNIVKVEGTVSSNASSVEINGQSAWVDDGAFFAWVELEEGANVIEGSAVIGGNQLDDSVTLTFTPNLTVFLDYPNGGTQVDYRVSPVTVNGLVTVPEATVTVNGSPVTVDAAGSFSADVQLGEDGGTLEVVAVSGGDQDSLVYAVPLDDAGHVVFDPYTSGFLEYNGSTEFPDTLTVTRGEMTVMNWTLATGKSIDSPQVCYVTVTGKENYSAVDKPLPSGLSITPVPVDPLVYPNTEYQMAFIIEAYKGLNPGTYSIEASVFVQDGFRSSQRIVITVE
ncbi:hypothetical protein Dehly_1562 [Dehalogenimonas lykanthroporepellens BL-DC-9]|nr:hypothetical protein Dehly_1562 [Dehalogenimonas lykanthroporepellens BL-DC-9]